MNLREIKSYFNKKPVEFIIKENNKLREDNEYVSRFKLKNYTELAGVPINEPMKPTNDIMVKAIKYGMIFIFNYKGEKDKYFAGHERALLPLVIGRSSKGKFLLRAYHLSGWSVSSNRHIKKVWRLFRMDRVLSITFTGSFYRLPPSGYNMEDKGMRGGIISRADFNEIRKNQQNLVKKEEIQNKDDVTMKEEGRSFATVKIKATNTKLDLMNALDNAYINNVKDLRNTRISFLKSIYGNKYIAIIGAIGSPGDTVKILDDRGINLGVFKVLESTTGDVLKRIKNIKGNKIYDLYIFDKKM